MKFQVVMIEAYVLVSAKTAEEAGEKAERQLGVFNQVDKILLKPKNIGDNIWQVPICVSKIGEPVEAESPEEAVNRIFQAIGFFPDTSISAIPVI